ncbi:MAG: helix-turn-helix domain-containing protein [Ornithinimicrobium sp.]
MAGVKSVERAVAVLHAVSVADRGLVELAEATDLPTSTTARLLATLEDLEVVTRSDRGHYRIGGALTSMTRLDVVAPTLREVAQPFMEELAFTLDEAIGLSVVCADDNLTIAQVDTPRPVQAENWEDTRWPLSLGSAGFAVVSTWPTAEIEQFVARHPDTPELAEQVAAIPASGVWWSEGTYVEGLTSAAVPLPDPTGRALGTLYVYGPSYRFPAHGDVRNIEESLLDSAARLTGSWNEYGGQAPGKGGSGR